MELEQIKLLQEFGYIFGKTGDLYEYMHTNEEFLNLPQDEKDDIGCQFNAMVLYQRFLQFRILRAKLGEELDKYLRTEYSERFTALKNNKVEQNNQ